MSKNKNFFIDEPLDEIVTDENDIFGDKTKELLNKAAVYSPCLDCPVSRDEDHTLFDYDKLSKEITDAVAYHCSGCNADKKK